MHSTKLIFFIVTTLLLPTLVQPYVRACYFTNWSQYRNGIGKYSPDHYTPGLCTHILYAFLTFGDDFILKPFEWNDESTEWSKGQMEKVNDLKKSDSNLKTLASVGGWNFGGSLFAKMSSTQEGRTKFINSVIPYIRKWGFDGFDIDWEYPQGTDQKANYVLLLKDLLDAFQRESQTSGKPRLLLTAAVSAGDLTIKSGYDIAQVAKYLDLTFLMSYDFHGAWDIKTGLNSPLYGRSDEPEAFKLWNTDSAARIWVENGMPKEKMVIGIATYGRGWTLANPTTQFGIDAPTTGPSKATSYVNTAGLAAYYELCTMVKQGATRVWEESHQTPYLYKGDQWYGYDDDFSVRNKMRFVKSNGYGGAFIWALDFDDFTGTCGSKYPLLNVIKEELEGQNIALVTALVSPGQPVRSTSLNPTIRPSVPATSTAATTTTTAVSVKSCNQVGFYPHPTNCQQFQLCYNSTIYPFTCPSGLIFNATMKYCTPPTADSNCTISAAKITTTTAASKAEDFTCTTDGFFKDPTSCDKFYRCVNGAAHTFTCPPGLFYNDIVEICDWPANVQC